MSAHSTSFGKNYFLIRIVSSLPDFYSLKLFGVRLSLRSSSLSIGFTRLESGSCSISLSHRSQISFTQSNQTISTSLWTTKTRSTPQKSGISPTQPGKHHHHLPRPSSSLSTHQYSPPHKRPSSPQSFVKNRPHPHPPLPRNLPSHQPLQHAPQQHSPLLPKHHGTHHQTHR